MSDTAITTTGLGKRFGRAWALHDCTIEVPEGRVSALVGANGAGKTTLMRMLTGLSRPTTGSATVAGRAPGDDADFLREIGYLAQDVPLYRRWTAQDHLAFGAHMNDRWDDQIASERLRHLRIPLDRPIDALSGGMRAQVALALALGKRPRVLLLDEPVAALDPLARRDFLGTLTAAVAEFGVTVLLSSHLLPDLERVCDHLVLLADGAPVLCAEIDDVLASHRLITAPRDALGVLERDCDVVFADRTARTAQVVVHGMPAALDPSWRVDEVDLEEIVLAYLGRSAPDRELEIVP